MEPVIHRNGECDIDTLKKSRAVKKKRAIRIFLSFLILCMLAFPFIVLYFFSSPTNINARITVMIPRGANVRNIATILYDANIIRTPKLFSLLARYNNIDTVLPSGEFQFDMPKNIFGVLNQLVLHDRGIEEIKITIPEGTANAHIADILSIKLPNFSRDEFLSSINAHEGYLFPDTYFFLQTATSGPIIEAMTTNFSTRTDMLYKESITRKKNWNDIIIMASIIEEEAVTDTERRMISGILWGRLERGMRLQVDAPFVYLFNKASSEVTLDDIASDSPYNTYRYKGLPPAPITNPGLRAIDAALNPTITDYVYYLSDREGITHYARTFEEHKLNKVKYLR